MTGPLACGLLCFLTGLEQLLRREDGLWVAVGAKTSPCWLLPPEDDTNFSGDALERGHWYCYVTASLSHADRSHFVNNLIMLLAVGPQLEQRLGSMGFLLLFLAAGAVGWHATLWRLRTGLGEELYSIAAKFQQGLGASPSTYALAVTASLLLPSEAAVGPVCGAHGEAIEATDARRSWVSTVLAVYLLPTFTSTGGVYDKREEGMCYVVLALMAMALHTALHGKLTAVNATAWMVLYHWKTFGRMAYKRLVRGHTMQSSDHATHFGGACVGLAAGVVIGGSLPGPWVLASVMGSITYLGLRAALDA